MVMGDPLLKKNKRKHESPKLATLKQDQLNIKLHNVALRRLTTHRAAAVETDGQGFSPGALVRKK
jgi:hypothetical protein